MWHTRRHGESNGAGTGRTTPEYRAWQAMLNRCYNKNAAGYENYGGRGIRVCERWRGSFECFLADMGRKPSPKHTLDRRENYGDYEPDNCRWATRLEQNRNTRHVHMLEIDGESRCVSEWSDISGTKRLTINSRLRRGWTPLEAVFGKRERSCQAL